MPAKNTAGSVEWTDPDDAPELTAEMLERAEVFDNNTYVRRGRGRPRSDDPKQQISVRLDPDVLAKLREAGPGWQAQINRLLREALGLVGAPGQRAA